MVSSRLFLKELGQLLRSFWSTQLSKSFICVWTTSFLKWKHIWRKKKFLRVLTNLGSCNKVLDGDDILKISLVCVFFCLLLLSSSFSLVEKILLKKERKKAKRKKCFIIFFLKRKLVGVALIWAETWIYNKKKFFFLLIFGNHFYYTSVLVLGKLFFLSGSNVPCCEWSWNNYHKSKKSSYERCCVL